MCPITFLLATLLFPCSYVQGQQTTCFENYELTAYTTPVTYYTAGKTCRDSGKYMIKVNSKPMADAVNRIMSGQYYIGAKLYGNKYVWQDGTNVPLNAQSGYQNWASGQLTGMEECVTINSGEWHDESCSSAYQYICQEDLSLKVTFYSLSGAVVTDRGMYRIRCSGPLKCMSQNTQNWYDDKGIKITELSSENVYQIRKNWREIELVVKNVDLSQNSSYFCHAPSTRMLQVRVPAVPAIQHIAVLTCKFNVTISWSSHIVVEPFLDRLFVKLSAVAEGTSVITAMDPPSDYTFFNLQPSTVYQISSSVCTDPSCSFEFRHLLRSVTTHGVPNKVTSANISQRGDYCVVEWNPPDVIGDNITEYKITVTRGFYASRSSMTNETFFHNTTNTSYVFEMQPMLIYAVNIQAVTCAGPGKNAVASGTCVGIIQAPAVVERPVITQTGIGAEVKIFVPDETRGLISCLFVVVTHGGELRTPLEERLGISALKLSFTSTILGQDIAISIPYKSVVGKGNIVKQLGDDSTTTCNLFEIGQNDIITNNWILVGKNRPVTLERQTGVYVVAIVPYQDDIYVRRSKGVLLPPEAEQATTAMPPNETSTVSELARVMIDAWYLAILTVIIPLTILGCLLGVFWQTRKQNASQKDSNRGRGNNYEISQAPNVSNPIPEGLAVGRHRDIADNDYPVRANFRGQEEDHFYVEANIGGHAGEDLYVEANVGGHAEEDFYVEANFGGNIENNYFDDANQALPSGSNDQIYENL